MRRIMKMIMTMIAICVVVNMCNLNEGVGSCGVQAQPGWWDVGYGLWALGYGTGSSYHPYILLPFGHVSTLQLQRAVPHRSRR